jgi:hypothetical protein
MNLIDKFMNKHITLLSLFCIYTLAIYSRLVDINNNNLLGLFYGAGIISIFFLIPLGIIISLVVTYFSIKNKNWYILIWWFYMLVLAWLSGNNVFIHESLEIINMDRGTVLPLLPRFQQHVGFMLHHLIFIIPVVILAYQHKQILSKK